MDTSSSIRHRFDIEIPRRKSIFNQLWLIRRYLINYESPIHVEKMISIQRG